MRTSTRRGRFFNRAGLSDSWNRAVGAVSDMVERRDPAKGHISDLARRLQEAIDQHWRTRHQSRYQAVKVLLTHWADTDDPSFRADEAAKSLAEVFRRLYSFDVQTWLIPTVDQPQYFLAGKLSQFVRDHGKEGNLLIFWYAGSAKETDGGKGPVMWKWGAEVNSLIVPQILGSAKSHVLTLYDCGSSLHGQGVSNAPVFEHLGASADESALSFGRPGSFTRSLIRILDKPDTAAFGICVLDLHRKLVNSAKRHQPGASAEDDNVSILSGAHTVSTAGSWLSRGLSPNPVYCHLSVCPSQSKGGASSIILSHLGYPLEVRQPRTGGEECEIEIKLQLERDDVHLDRWQQWILEAPWEASKAAVTGS
ncbi:hypothetical protein JX265_004908 [Neoarthrinium moseri]|uniref:Uncharacterized protein n=1 Tax=Neoarthrinium moseri TaxID=1658444 RepID=A0A9P9WQ97_9PEZI|nr:hypothetical protein JX265_004908 [Neoarthrinium moseri]